MAKAHSSNACRIRTLPIDRVRLTIGRRLAKARIGRGDADNTIGSRLRINAPRNNARISARGAEESEDRGGEEDDEDNDQRPVNLERNVKGKENGIADQQNQRARKDARVRSAEPRMPAAHAWRLLAIPGSFKILDARDGDEREFEEKGGNRNERRRAHQHAPRIKQ